MTIEKQAADRHVVSSTLEGLGKKAARLSGTSGLSLEEAVIQTLGGEKLSSAQVRRVVEYANIEAVNGKFASLQGRDRITHIAGGPADPEHVLAALKISADQGTAQHFSTMDYLNLPARASSPTTKTASAATPQVGMNLADLHNSLSATHEELVARVDGTRFRMEEALGTLKLASRTALLEGASVAELQSAWSKIHPGAAKFAAAVVQKEYGAAYGVKLASREVSPEHNVVRHFTAFAKLAQQCQLEDTARRQVEKHLADVAEKLRRA